MNTKLHRSIGNWLLIGILGMAAGCGTNPAENLHNHIACGRAICDDPGEMPQPPAVKYPKFEITMETYPDCAALQSDTRARIAAARERERAWNAYFDRLATYNAGIAQPMKSGSAPVAMEDQSASSSGAEGATAAKSITNLQEDGIDEADFVKASSHSLFIARGDQIEVVDRKSLTVRGTIQMSRATEDLFVTQERLVAITKNPLSVTIFSPDQGEMPVIERTTSLSGTLKQARLTNGHLLLIIDDVLPLEASAAPTNYNLDLPENPVVTEGDVKVADVACNRISRPQIADEDWRLVKVLSINTQNPQSPIHSTGFLGAGDHVYMGQSAIYVSKQGMNWRWYRNAFEDGAGLNDSERIIITKVAFDKETGALNTMAVGGVYGRAKDQWAFKEFPDFGGTLAVATSSGYLWSTDAANLAQNHLYFLTADQGMLKEISAIHNFGTGEDIRAVRYVDRTAYVVTFKKTDPLFAFDLTDLKAPQRLGELKIPGFSTYLHPVSAKRLVGVGFDAQDQGEFAWYAGIKVSLFDVENPREMIELDHKILGARGSTSDITGNHHGFYFDAKHQLIGIPIVEVSGGHSGIYGQKTDFSGAVIYRIENDQLVEAARLSHKDMTPNRCHGYVGYSWWETATMSYDINRLYTLDDRLISVSRFGIKTWDLATLTETNTSSFPPLTDGHLNDLGICMSYCGVVK